MIDPTQTSRNPRVQAKKVLKRHKSLLKRRLVSFKFFHPLSCFYPLGYFLKTFWLRLVRIEAFDNVQPSKQIFLAKNAS
jgi:hypothetical protein